MYFTCSVYRIVCLYSFGQQNHDECSRIESVIFSSQKTAAYQADSMWRLPLSVKDAAFPWATQLAPYFGKETHNNNVISQVCPIKSPLYSQYPSTLPLYPQDIFLQFYILTMAHLPGFGAPSLQPRCLWRRQRLVTESIKPWFLEGV